jgi:hypothetical protein
MKSECLTLNIAITMKKTYINPAIEIVKISGQSLMQASVKVTKVEGEYSGDFNSYKSDFEEVIE